MASFTVGVGEGVEIPNSKLEIPMNSPSEWLCKLIGYLPFLGFGI